MTKSVKIALGVTLVLVVWMASGLNQTPPVQSSKEVADTETLMKVEATHSIAQLTHKTVELQGQVEPYRVLSVKAEVDGAIEQLPVQLGQRVEAGSLLMEQAMKFRLAQRAQAIAQINHRESLLAASKKLLKQKLASESKVAEDQAMLAAAQAELARINYEIEHVKIVAPFAGVIDERLVEMGDFVDKGQPVVSLVDDNQLKITAMVPQHQLGSLKVGQQVVARLVNGEQTAGELTFIATKAQQATRSYRIEVLVDNAAHHRWVGMSATLDIPVAKVKGHRVKTSAVGLSTAGDLQVKVVDSDNTVKAFTIDIISQEKDSLWISGLPDEVELITLGQNFVSAGQKVIAQKAADNAIVQAKL